MLNVVLKANKIKVVLLTHPIFGIHQYYINIDQLPYFQAKSIRHHYINEFYLVSQHKLTNAEMAAIMFRRVFLLRGR